MGLMNNRTFWAIIEKSRRSFKTHGGYTSEQVRKQLGLKPLKRSQKKKGRSA